jgi:hypothetical protein
MSVPSSQFVPLPDGSSDYLPGGQLSNCPVDALSTAAKDITSFLLNGTTSAVGAADIAAADPLGQVIDMPSHRLPGEFIERAEPEAGCGTTMDPARGIYETVLHGTDSVSSCIPHNPDFYTPGPGEPNFGCADSSAGLGDSCAFPSSTDGSDGI